MERKNTIWITIVIIIAIYGVAYLLLRTMAVEDFLPSFLTFGGIFTTLAFLGYAVSGNFSTTNVPRSGNVMFYDAKERNENREDHISVLRKLMDFDLPNLIGIVFGIISTIIGLIV